MSNLQEHNGVKRQQYSSIDGLRSYPAIAFVFLHIMANSDYGINDYLYQTFIPYLSNFSAIFTHWAIGLSYVDALLCGLIKTQKRDNQKAGEMKGAIAGMMNKSDKIYVAGHQGMVGSAISRELKQSGFTDLLLRTHAELDLTRQADVEAFMACERPDYIFLAAAKVGGIQANEEALADFMYINMMMEMNVIHAAWKNNAKRLLFLGSSCIYPRLAAQPIQESSLLTGELEKTNEAYALAKISGLKYCEYLNRQYGTDYISIMPTNLYGPNDNYHPTHSHVLPALIRRFHEAKENHAESVTCWGDGSPKREFLFVNDLAELCVFAMDHYRDNETLNAGTGVELTIKELTDLVAQVVGYTGLIAWDTSKPNGTPRKLLDVSKSKALGWQYKTELREGIRLAYKDFLDNPARAER